MVCCIGDLYTLTDNRDKQGITFCCVAAREGRMVFPGTEGCSYSSHLETTLGNRKTQGGTRATLSLARFTEQKYPCSCYLQLYWLHGAALAKGTSHRWLVTKCHFSSRHKHEDLQLFQFHKILRPGSTGHCLPRINPASHLHVLRVTIQRTAVLASPCNEQ